MSLAYIDEYRDAALARRFGRKLHAERWEAIAAREAGLDLKGFRDRSWFGLFAPRPPAKPVPIAALTVERPDRSSALLWVMRC